MKKLFEPLKIGNIDLKNRIVMAPLTRSRCDPDATPSKLMIEYYRQRASAGLIIAEATAVTPMGLGYPNTPGIWSESQILAWRKITDAVHEEGGKIVLQIWHVGRMSDPVYLNGELPVAPSQIAPRGHISLIRPKKKFVVPRELEIVEIQEIVEEFRKGAENAMKAGFDGVEIHGANGYLPNQFFNTGSNHRKDSYGGSLENRARFMLEILDAVVTACGAGHVGLHISPQEGEGSMLQSDYITTLKEYSYLMEEVNKRKIAFVFIRESFYSSKRFAPELKNIYDGTIILNEDFTPQEAENAIKNGDADAVAFGQLFISNPDLPHRIMLGSEFNELVPERYYYTPIESGYTDYPHLASF